MPNEEWGTKRLCPTTGKRFYDLNKNPIISPYTGEEVEVDNSKDESLVDDDDSVDVDLDDDILDDDDDDDDTVPLDDLADVASDDED